MPSNVSAPVRIIAFAYGVVYPANAGDADSGPLSLVTIPSHHVVGVSEALAGMFMETLLFGSFLIIAKQCMSALYRYNRRTKTHAYLSGTFAILLVLISIRFVVDLTRTLHAFTNPLEGGHIDMKGFTGPDSVVPNALLVAAVVVSDAFLIFRCYMIWKDRAVLVGVPALLTLATFAMGIYAVHKSSSIADDGAMVLANESMDAFLYFALGTNIACTLLLAFRVWLLRRRASRSRLPGSAKDHSVDLPTLASESVVFYTLLLAAEIVTSSMSSFSTIVFANMICPTIGIVFSHLIIRVTRDTTIADDLANVYARRSSQIAGRHLGGLRSAMPGDNESQTEVHVQLETSVHVDSDSGSQAGASSSKVNVQGVVTTAH
ncbi:hypothetical protein AURDEDRAFT_188352 [Auricularia subglabra TFB-10046 SS5]|nr:hypothetical protein AURDEDRAFT_188352 [Auricularia subglabra TFB-10046 SS5]